MRKKTHQGFIKLSTLIFLGIVLAGLGFMYYKGYRVDVSTRIGAGAGAGAGAGSGAGTEIKEEQQPRGFYYTVQVSVTPNESNAMALVNDLEQDGYDAYYDTYQSPRGGRQYKIRVGQYGDRQSAKAVLTQVKHRYVKLRDSFVKAVDD